MDGLDSLSIISIAAIVEQQITFFAMAIAAILLWRERRKLRSTMLSFEGSNETSPPIVIVIGIGMDNSADVEKYLKNNNIKYLKISKYIMPGTFQPKDYYNTMIAINKLKDEAQKLGVSRAMLFYGGLVDLAIHTGASFSNWVPIDVFAFDKTTGTYVRRFTMTTETTRMDSLTDEMIRKIQEFV